MDAPAAGATYGSWLVVGARRCGPSVLTEGPTSVEGLLHSSLPLQVRKAAALLPAARRTA